MCVPEGEEAVASQSFVCLFYYIARPSRYDLPLLYTLACVLSVMLGIPNINKQTAEHSFVVGTSKNQSSSTFIPRKVLGKFTHISDQPLKRPNGKTLVFFMGAGFCPFCASERWAIIRALSNFGSWQGIVETASADHNEKYLNIPTVNFANAIYTSDHVQFVGRETADRNFEPEQELDERDYEILDAFNPDQIIPFLLIDGQFMQAGSGYSPQLLEGMDHAKVKAELANPDSSVGKAIRSEADNITALVCKSINDKASVCDSESIKTLAGKT
jgi:hypothetical protein